jgi:hypothetical protein
MYFIEPTATVTSQLSNYVGACACCVNAANLQRLSNIVSIEQPILVARLKLAANAACAYQSDTENKHLYPFHQLRSAMRDGVA